MKTTTSITAFCLGLLLIYACSDLEVIAPEPTFSYVFSEGESSIGFDIEQLTDSTWMTIGYETNGSTIALKAFEIDRYGQVLSFREYVASNGKGRPQILKLADKNFLITGSIEQDGNPTIYVNKIDEKLNPGSGNAIGQGDFFSAVKKNDNELILSSSMSGTNDVSIPQVCFFNRNLIQDSLIAVVDTGATALQGANDFLYGGISLAYSNNELVLLSDGRNAATNDGSDIILQKFTLHGELLPQATRVYDIEGHDHAAKILAKDSQDGYMVCGYSGTASGAPFARLYNRSLTQIKAYRGTGNSIINNAISTNDGGYLLIGNQAGFSNTPYLIKLSSTLQVEWEREYPNVQGSEGSFNNGRQLANGGYILVGYEGNGVNKVVRVTQTNREGIVN